MRRVHSVVYTGLVLVSLAVSSCQSPPTAGVSPQEAAPLAQKAIEPPKAALPAPKTPADVEKIGIPVYPGSVLDEKPDSATVDEKSYSRVYKVKMYAPTDYITVVGFYVKSLKDPVKIGVGTEQRINGKSAEGDDVQIMLGPAYDHGKTLVMAWLTQDK